MSFEFLKKIIEGINKLDFEVNDYKKVVQNPYIPSIAYVNWALHLAEEGKMEEAESKLVASTLMAHQTPEAYISLGVLRAKERKFDEAKKYYIKAIRLDNNNSKAYCFLGNVLTETKEYKEAEKKFEHAIKLSPNNFDILLNWGILFVRQRKFQQAKEKFQQASKLSGSNFTALYFLGLVDIELGNQNEAKEKFELITSISQTHYESFYYLAYIYFKEKNYELSLDYALKALENGPQKVECYMLIAENYMNLKNREECFKYYQLGATNSRINYYFLISWGIALQEFDFYEESKEKFQQATELDNENDLGFGYLGIAFYNQRDYHNAIKILQRALEINPQNVTALDKLGEIYFDTENYIEAIKYFELALKNSAKAVGNYAKIAQSYFLDGNIEKANYHYEKAVEYQPNEKCVYISYARILIEQKNYDYAHKKLLSAYKIDDKDKDCLNMLFYVNYILAKENISDYNIERAINIAVEIEEKCPDSFIFKKEKEELETKLNSKIKERQ